MRARVAVVALAASLLIGNARAACNVTTLTCGSSSSGNMGGSSCLISGTPGVKFAFSGSVGQVVSLTVAANSDFHTFWLTLYSPTGTVLTSAFDEPAQIFRFTLPSSGTYSVEARLASTSDSTGYTMSLTCESSTTPGTCGYTATIPIGTVLGGALATTDTACGNSKTYVKAYKVPVNAGDAFTVDYVTSFPGYLELDGPDSSGAFRTATAAGTVSTTYLAGQTGNVTLYAAANTTAPTTGAFTLTVTPLTLPSCGRVRAVRH